MKYIVDPFSEKTSLNTLYRLLRHYAEKWPDKEALVFDAGNQRMTFRGWLDSVDKLALELSRRGVKRVTLWLCWQKIVLVASCPDCNFGLRCDTGAC